MFNFDSLTVSELKALCVELGITVGDSARKSDYVSALDTFFQSENVDEALMALKRDNLQKVARRFSLTASGTKRELTDAILAKVNPQSSEATSEDEAEQAEETRKGLPWWAWVLIVLAAAFLLWGIFRPRQVATDDPSPLQEAIGQVSTKVDNLGQEITGLTDRVTALEQAPAAESEVKVPSEPVVISPTEFDGSWTYDGRSGYHAFFVEVDQPGDVAKFAVYCEVECPTVIRLSPDDELVAAYVVNPDGTKTDISFELIDVPAGGTGDAELDANLSSRGANIKEGEILQQSKAAVEINARAGSCLVFELKDKEELAVNVGLFIAIGE